MRDNARWATDLADSKCKTGALRVERPRFVQLRGSWYSA